MSDTPRTDANDTTTNRMWLGARVVPAEFARELEREIGRYEETLHDGYAVACKLSDDERRYTTPENVSAVLNAFKRALKANDQAD